MDVHRFISTRTILLLTVLILLISAFSYMISGQFHHTMMDAKKHSHFEYILNLDFGHFYSGEHTLRHLL